MNLSLRVCALVATLMALLGLAEQLTAKPPDLPVNDPPILAPEDSEADGDGSAEQASPPAAQPAWQWQMMAPRTQRGVSVDLSSEALDVNDDAPSAPSREQPSPKKAPCAPAKPADKDGFTCPYLKQQAADRHAALLADPEVSQDVLGNLDKLEAAQSLLAAADKLQHAGRPGEALGCLSLVQKLCPGSRYAAEAGDKAAHLAGAQKSRAGTDEAAEEGEARPQTKGSSRAKPCCCTKRRPTVSAIVIQGNKRVATEKIRLRLQTQIGGEYDPKAIQADMGRLWETGQFQQVDARMALDGPGKCKVYFVVQDLANKIKKVEYRGAKHLKDSELAELTHIAVGQSLNPQQNLGACYEIIKKLNEEGRALADCKLLKGGQPSDDEVIFQISEGPKVALCKEQPGTVSVQNQIQERPMVKVGKIQVIGNTRSRDEVKLRQAPLYTDRAEKSAQPPESGVEEMVSGLMKACRLAVADNRQEQAIELARQAQALDPKSVLADPLVYRMAQLAGKPQKKTPVSNEEPSCPACHVCTPVKVVTPLTPCCPCVDGGIVQAFEQLLEEAERAVSRGSGEQAEPASPSTCPAEQHQAGGEEKSEAEAGWLSCVQQWLNGQEHGSLVLGLGMDEQLHCFVKCNMTVGERVYHLVAGRGCPLLWTTPNAAVTAKKTVR